MKRWGNRLVDGIERAAAGKLEDPAAKQQRQIDAAARAKERTRLADEERGTIYESKMKRRE